MQRRRHKLQRLHEHHAARHADRGHAVLRHRWLERGYTGGLWHHHHHWAAPHAQPHPCSYVGVVRQELYLDLWLPEIKILSFIYITLDRQELPDPEPNYATPHPYTNGSTADPPAHQSFYNPADNPTAHAHPKPSAYPRHAAAHCPSADALADARSHQATHPPPHASPYAPSGVHVIDCGKAENFKRIALLYKLNEF